jgi:hypothetical protein
VEALALRASLHMLAQQKTRWLAGQKSGAREPLSQSDR